ncbi:replication-associated recombination protein A [Dethiosulfovibrio salsuginis]|uniref:Putative ATPase n=1 Tax=Dethiosulfovibrio salsuginis TaxID=561720 RepID=A0A1X7JL04_9BACT|nr:replication-associated recombination protein A [Dethiosulfovibrio salsuginis]SMG28848.1 putative ATPase [Dethiosulfovibrio salsuginis]
MICWETPLAERMRPSSLDEYVGHSSIIAPGTALRSHLERGVVPSCILYGPPGVGKTALVRLMASVTDRELFEINAVSAKVSQLRELIDQGEKVKSMSGRSVVAFVDEIYHFNKSQQNALLPAVEKGDVVLVGTTTENPWFEINKTLLSRLMVLTIDPLTEEDLVVLMSRALEDREKGLGSLELSWDQEVLREIALSAGGDGRQALTRLEYLARSVAASGGSHISLERAKKDLPRASVRHDKGGDNHYQVISAFIKSIRGSDPDATIYWLARLLDSGEDIRFIARRMVISAAEDVGLADPMALMIATSAAQASDMTGMPEARIILGEAALYLASAPKSNRAYEAINSAISDIESGAVQRVPDHLINGNRGYLYPHDYRGHWVAQSYLKEPKRYYFPSDSGYESRVLARLKRFWRRFREGSQKDS